MSKTESVIALHATNMGPGPAILHSCIVRTRKPWSLKRGLGLLNPIEGNPFAEEPISRGPFSGGLPAKIEAGDTKAFYFPFTKDGILANRDIKRFGVHDTYGRYCWCKRKQMRIVRERHAKSFPPSQP